MADNDKTQTQTKDQTQSQRQDQTPQNREAPGGDPDNTTTIQNMDAPELRNAVVELLTIIDDSDDLDIVVTVADDGTVTVATAA